MSTRPFGNIRKLPSGKYQARYTGPDGRQHRGPHPFSAKADARLFLSEQETALKRGRWVDPKAGDLTLRTYADAWLAGKTAIAPSTRELYTYFLDKHVYPDLGGKSLNRITSGDIRRWHADLSRRDLHPNTVAKIYRLLRQILSHAVDDERLAKNPCTIKNGGKEQVTERLIPSLDQVETLLQAIEERYRPIVEVAAFAGLRFGEIAGLQRKHFNPLHRQLTIEQQLDSKRKRGEITFRPTKTDAGNRTITLPDRLVRSLELHIERYDITDPNQLMFTAPTGKPIDRHNFRRRIWLPALKEAGVDHFRFHDLRHLAATLVAASGVSLKTIMHHIGHTTTEAAMRYQHSTQEQEERVARHLNDILNRTA